MTKPTIEVKGADGLRRALRQVEGGTSDLKAAHLTAAKVVSEEGSRLAPKRSGKLAASVRAAGQARQGVVRAGFARIPYAGVIHFGWAARNIQPQPFLYDALDSRTGEVMAVYEKQVDSIIKKNGL